MFGETTIFYLKIWDHPTETTIKKWLFSWLVRTTPTLLRPFARHLGSGKWSSIAHASSSLSTVQLGYQVIIKPQS